MKTIKLYASLSLSLVYCIQLRVYFFEGVVVERGGRSVYDRGVCVCVSVCVCVCVCVCVLSLIHI